MNRDKPIFQSMMEQTEDCAIIHLDLNGKIQSWNKGAEKITGYTHTEVMEKNAGTFSGETGQGHAPAQDILAQVIAAGKLQQEGWVSRKDGSRFWGNTSITALYDNESRPAGFIKIIYDLTEKQSTQERLKALNELEQSVAERDTQLAVSEAKYKVLFANNPLPMWVFDLKTFRFLDVNEIACFHYGYSREEFLSMTVIDIRPEGEKASFKEADHPLSIEPEESHRGSWKHRKKDGSIIDVEIFAHDLLFEGKNARIIIINDITARRAVERKLESSERHFRALVENSNDAIFLQEKNGNIIYQTSAANRILGYSAEEVLGKNLLDFYHPDEREDGVRLLEKVIASPGKPVDSINRMLTKDGRYIWVEGTITNMLEDHDVNALVKNFRDVSERVAAEQKIEKSNWLYSFLSQINQCLVHATDEQNVFENACAIAIEHGKFKVAWVGIFDFDRKIIDLIEHRGIPEHALPVFSLYEKNIMQMHVLASGTYYVNNDIQNSPDAGRLHAFFAENELKSCISLPLERGGRIVGTFNLYSTEPDFFNAEEINLLVEGADDISFALNIFEKEKLRIAAEKKLSHNQQRLEQAQTMAHFGSWELDFATGLAKWSDEACRIYGLATNDNVQTYEKWISFIHPDDLPAVLEELEKSQKVLGAASFYHRIISLDNKVKYLFSQSQFEFDDHHRPIGIYGVTHDVTESKEAEIALAQSEANLRLIIDLMPQAIFVKDVQGRYRFVNKRFADFFNTSPRELISGSKAGRSLPDHAEAFSEQDEEVLRTGITTTIPELRFRTEAGEEKIFYTVKVPYAFGRAREESVLGIATDITEQKRLEADRNKMIVDITQRNENLEQFSYIVSHNLRAPVANIIGLTELLQTIQSPEQEKETLGGLHLSVKKLDEIIRDLNEILKIRDKVNEQKEPVIFSELCKDIRLSINSLLMAGGTNMITDFSAIDTFYTVKSYLYSIFYNLISNSIKYRQPDVPLVIEIYSIKHPDKIELVFKDNGLGIDLKRFGDKVFGLYKRFHTDIEGKGMGLYMVKTQVQNIGGDISIESEVNRGTVFRIFFDIE